MKNQNNVSLLESLKQLPTSDLDTMLHSELEKEFPSKNTVQLILDVLRERESDYPVISNPQIIKAWNKYQSEKTKDFTSAKQFLIKTAAILILCSLLLFSLPREVQAESFFERFITWTEHIFALLNPWAQGAPPNEYIFQTDHPGLQTLYNTVTELGVTVPVVPMYLDGYDLTYCDVLAAPTHNKVIGNFINGKTEAVFELNIYFDRIPREFHKNEAALSQRELNGIIHYIFQNNELWTVVWTRDNLECYIVIECQEEELYQILDSIYTMED